MSEHVDQGRRQLLTAATALTGAVGAAFAAVPFLASWKPSARAKALGAPVEIDISKLEPGALLKVEWRGKPVWVLHRTSSMLDNINANEGELRDPDSEQPQQPDYARNDHRSIRPEILVMVGSCTHLGCAPIERFDVAPSDLGPSWKGGFYCPCHKSKFDMAGRVYKGVPAPANLRIPPYSFLDDQTLVIGVNPEGAV